MPSPRKAIGMDSGRRSSTRGRIPASSAPRPTTANATSTGSTTPPLRLAHGVRAGGASPCPRKTSRYSSSERWSRRRSPRPGDRRVVEGGEQRGGILVDGHRTGPGQLAPAGAAAGQTDAGDVQLAGGGDVPHRVTDEDHAFGGEPGLLQRGDQDVRRRLALLARPPSR